ncbi:MAG: hypothetical protein ACE5FF_10215, partial [Saprospiraceae bacterium]
MAQALPVVVDGVFDEWQGTTVVTDPVGDANNLDFLSVELANDADFLYLRFKLSQEISLTD